MSDARPDPDQLLARLHDEAARATRGKLKIFFGASAGVGKTYGMLAAARLQREQGVDVVVGIVETHGRAETEAALAGFEQLPRRSHEYRGRALAEFDLDGALARKPALILVDELAHTNVAGSRHPKRWQDVEELLAAGIDVYTTVNVQHLDSLNDVVGGITGIRVRETVPDRVFALADSVVLIDLPPDELLQRLKEGKVYLPDQAEQAIQRFFRKGNLLALRELALRRTADRVDGDMLQYRREQSVSSVWQTRDSQLVCIGPGTEGERLVRRAARQAAQLDAPWHAVYVETPALQRLGAARRKAILAALQLASDMGAETAVLADADPVQAITRYAREHNLARLLVGASIPHAWTFWRTPFATRLARHAPDLDVIQAARDDAVARPAALPLSEPGQRFAAWRAPASAWLASVGACAVAAALGGLLHPAVELTNIGMLFLLAVVLVGVRYGRGPAVLAAFLGVAAFDFLFVSPQFSFAVSDAQYLVTFAVMLSVGLITGQLTAGLKYQARVATHREARMRALYEMSRELSGALLPEQIAEICARFVGQTLDARPALLLADAGDRLRPPLYGHLGGQDGTDGPMVDMGIAQWAFDHGEPAGAGTDTLPAAPLLYQPLRAPMNVRGVLALEFKDPRRLLAPEQRRLLDTLSSLVAIALERVHYVQVAQDTTVQMESEQLRNSLLAALSHDLRTPLTALVGEAEVLANALANTPSSDMRLSGTPEPDTRLRDTARAIRDQAMRLGALVNNLLDMARLQAGHVQLNLQWQPLEEVVGSALTLAAPLLGTRTVAVDLPPELPFLEFDAILMERVFYNLFENAAKYTPAGSRIALSARVAGDRMEIRVTDDGPGLPRGREEAVFEKFTRGARETPVSGVGLGLAICRAIVEAHHGRIRAENRPEGGVCFVITLPLGSPPAMDPEGEPLRPLPGDDAP
ncbi:two-component system sensor histidine kinase KdbD [Imbroritus primus]|uniref:Two-component system sensor histidine kinase KdbD n=1 Tax=Imbroritus primus TaxID=3058603 RepID=A0ACD3SMZ0_9BURK|nr:two-component system sensor histidine kinase KdbD [Burkholderiaceae bacterium PBA]